jgi:hypothetical protein
MYVLPSTALIKGVFRVAPVFRPRLVTMITGRPVSLNVSQPAYFLNGFTQAHTSIICMQQHHLWGMFFNQRHARGGIGGNCRNYVRPAQPQSQCGEVCGAGI